jgi:cytochrome c-type biogenesis protein CcmH/NrfF
LWLAAPAVLILGGLIAWVGYRNRKGRAAPDPLDRREQESLQRLLSEAQRQIPTLPNLNRTDSGL